MARCRCNDIANATRDLAKLKDTRDYTEKALQASKSTVNGALKRLAGNILDGVTPNNCNIFQSIEGKLEKPAYDGIKNSHDKCVNKLSALPGEIQALSREDCSYHTAMMAKNSLNFSSR